MRTASLACTVILLATLACYAQLPNQLTPAERAGGWQLLFNGKDMAGWEDPRQKVPPGDSWAIEDGCLKALARPKINEDLFTIDKFGSFELVFDWRIGPGANSGVKYRIQDRVFLAERQFPRFEDQVNYSVRHRPARRPTRGQEYVIGFEYQVIDNHTHSDAIRGAKYQAASIYDMVGPSRDMTRPIGEFNHSRLVLRGNHLEHWLNGVKVVDADLMEASKSAATRWGLATPVYNLLARQPVQVCPISLQNHGDEAWFRSIKIRRFN